MDIYEMILEALQYQVDNGELTLEEAEEVNDVAYDRYVLERDESPAQRRIRAMYKYKSKEKLDEINQMAKNAKQMSDLKGVFKKVTDGARIDAKAKTLDRYYKSAKKWNKCDNDRHKSLLDRQERYETNIGKKLGKKHDNLSIKINNSNKKLTDKLHTEPIRKMKREADEFYNNPNKR